jgi:exopolysaccharide biosynthesis protein
VDLRNANVKVQAHRAVDSGVSARSFKSMVNRTQPIVAITGTFFDPNTNNIICNLVRDGKLIERGAVGNTITVSSGGQGRWLATARRNALYTNWKKTEFAISSGPTLVRNSKVALHPVVEGFRDPGLFRSAPRCGIGLTASGKLILVTVNHDIKLRDFARIMQKLGARDALNLDGGGSTALYAHGRYLSLPSRQLTNVVLVTPRK